MAAVYKEYNPETLKKLQKIELDMLKDFDHLCEINGIDYFCWAGTAIGVLRHGGFIPWDDDIDIGLLRPDYEKLLKCIADQMGDKYDLLNTKNDPTYPLMTTRMVLRGTRFQEECFKNLSCNFGIFLDLYCFDYVPDKERIRKKECLSFWIKSKLMILCAIGDPVLYFTGVKGAIVRFGCQSIHALLKALSIQPVVFYNSIEKKLKDHRFPTARIAFQFDTKLHSALFEMNDVFPTKRMAFEDISIRCPAQIKKITKRDYGDFMKLPPPDQRHNHPPYDLSFGEYDTMQ